MKFSPSNIQNLASSLDKMRRYFAFKHEVPKDNVAFVVKGHGIHVMIDGIMKESTSVQGLANCNIDNETGELIKANTPRQFSYTSYKRNLI